MFGIESDLEGFHCISMLIIFAQLQTNFENLYLCLYLCCDFVKIFGDTQVF